MPEYDLVVIGGGSAGLAAAREARDLGYTVLVIEKERFGGDSLSSGSVPAQSLIRTAGIVQRIKRSEEFGLPAASSGEIELAKVMDRVRETTREIGARDEADAKRDGIDIAFGNATFRDPHIVDLGGKPVAARFFVICTGSRPAVSEIEGIASIPYYTGRTIFEMKRVPESLLVIGCGGKDIALAQAFQRFGSFVTIFQPDARLLPDEDEEMSALLSDLLSEEGLQIFTGAEVQKITHEGGKKKVSFAYRDKVWSMEGEEVLIAGGRLPNVEGLSLERAGVRVRAGGIEVDRYFRTATRNIYACGEVIGGECPAHLAAYQARAAVQHALAGTAPADPRPIPWTLFTDPELARAGITESEARESGSEEIAVQRLPFVDVDRGVTDREMQGLIKILADAKGNILGTHIVGPRAGELIHEFVLAMRHGITLEHIASTLHAYPTLSYGCGQAAEKGSLPASDRSSLAKLIRGLTARA